MAEISAGARNGAPLQLRVGIIIPAWTPSIAIVCFPLKAAARIRPVSSSSTTPDAVVSPDTAACVLRCSLCLSLHCATGSNVSREHR